MIDGASIDSEVSVLAVLVLYGHTLGEAQAWPMIERWLGGSLRHCLVYDNSPDSRIDARDLPPNAELIRNSGNGGTASAYASGVTMAAEQGCEWLLLLDQDTALPHDYLARVRAAIACEPASSVLVPQVRHGNTLVSPAVISARGTVRPGMSASSGAIRTAISSGMVVRREALATVLPFPPEIWLDYVDHWMFGQFADRGRVIGDIDAVLAHDLSLRNPGTLTRARLENILAAETAYHAHHGGLGRFDCDA